MSISGCLLVLPDAATLRNLRRVARVLVVVGSEAEYGDGRTFGGEWDARMVGDDGMVCVRLGGRWNSGVCG